MFNGAELRIKAIRIFDPPTMATGIRSRNISGVEQEGGMEGRAGSAREKPEFLPGTPRLGQVNENPNPGGC